MGKLLQVQRHNFDTYIRVLWFELVLYQGPLVFWDAWGFDADGVFAICTPWFDFYPFVGLR